MTMLMSGAWMMEYSLSTNAVTMITNSKMDTRRGRGPFAAHAGNDLGGTAALRQSVLQTFSCHPSSQICKMHAQYQYSLPAGMMMFLLLLVCCNELLYHQAYKSNWNVGLRLDYKSEPLQA